MTLPKHPGKVLAQKKLQTLSKYFSIPDKFLKFYPKCKLQKQNVSSDTDKKKISIKRPGNPGTDNVMVKRRRVGRPPKPLEPITGVQFITKFLGLIKITLITNNTVLIIKACSWFKNVIIVMQAGTVARF